MQSSVRVELLTAFRDHFILPRLERIQDAFLKMIIDIEEYRNAPDSIPRCLQMFGVLSEIDDDRRVIIEATVSELKTNLQRYGRAVYG